MSTAASALPPAWGEGDSLDRVLEAASGRRMRQLPGGDWLVQCVNPAHEDRNPSMQVTWVRTEHGGRTLLRCYACGTSAIEQEEWAGFLGLEYDDLFDDRRWTLHNRHPKGRRSREYKSPGARRTGATYSRLGKLPARIAGKVHELLGQPAPPAEQDEDCSHTWVGVEDYEYVDEQGTLVQVVHRQRCSRTGCGAKNFPSRWPDPAGGWFERKKDATQAGVSTDPVLYRLPDVLAAAAAGEQVWLLEGEKDVHAAEALGLVATTNPGGSNSFPEEMAAPFAGAHVRLVLDRDPAGWMRGFRVPPLLLAAGAASVRIFLPAATAPKSDFSDHLAAGHGLDDLLEVPAEAVRAWVGLREVESHLAMLGVCEAEAEAHNTVAAAEGKAGRKDKADQHRRHATRWAREATRVHEKLITTVHVVRDRAQQVPDCDWAQEALEVAVSSARSGTSLVTALFTLLQEATPRSLHEALDELVVAAETGTRSAQAATAGEQPAPAVDGSGALAPAGDGAGSGGGRGWDPKVLHGGGEGGGGSSGDGIRRVVRISGPHYEVVLDRDSGRLELVEIKQQSSSRRRGEEDVELEQVFTRLLNAEVRLVRREFAEADDDIDDELVDLHALGDRDTDRDATRAASLAHQTHAVVEVRVGIQDEPMRVRIPFDEYVDGSFVAHLKVPGLDFLGTRSGKEKIVSAINAVSAAAEIVTSYRATGWRVVDGQDVYITAGGAIGADGWAQVVSNLTGPLARYDLPSPCTGDPARLRQAFLDHSAGLMNSFPDRVGAALLGTAYRAVLAPNEWVTVLTASPGVGKTGLAALTMHHFGELWDRNRPLTSLSGNGATANALRILAHRCKDALMYLDDNAPTTGLEAAYKRLEEIIRMIHNAEDRARANRSGDEVSSGGRPRTSALMTSEVPPRAGTSGERRALMVPLTREEISIDAIRALDTLSSRHGRALLMSSFLQWIARTGRASALERAAELRAEFGSWLRTHPRSAPIHQRHGDKITELWVGWALMLDFLGHTQALTAEETAQWRTRVADALVVAAETCEDPDMVTSTGQRVCELLRYAMANNIAYAADITDASLPPVRLESRTGWIAQVRHEDSVPVTTWRRSERAIHLGYVNTDVHRADDCSAELVCTKSGLEATLKAAAAVMTDTSTLDLGTALRALAEEGVLKTAQVVNPGGGTTVRRLINRTIPAEQDTQGRPVRGKRIVLRLDALLDDEQDGGTEDDHTPPPAPAPPGGWSTPAVDEEDTSLEGGQTEADVTPADGQDHSSTQQEDSPMGFVHTNAAGLSLESHPMSRGDCARPGCHLAAAVGFAGLRLHLPCFESTTAATVAELHQLVAPAPAPAPAPAASAEPARQQTRHDEVAAATTQEPTPAEASPRPSRTAGTTTAPFVASVVVVDVDGYYLPGQAKTPLPYPITHAGHLEQLGRDLRIGTAPMKWRKYPEAGLVVPTAALWEQLGVPTDVPARASKRRTWFEEVSTGLAFLTDAAADGWVFGRGEGDPVLRGMTRLRRHDAARGTAAIMFTPGMPTDWGLGPDLDPAAVATRLQLFTDAVGMPFHASPISTGLDLLRILMPREVREQLTAANAVDYEGVGPAWNPECEPSFDWTRTPTPAEAQTSCLALFDRGGSYLSTWSSLKIGVGAPEHHGDDLAFDARRAGWWLVQLPDRSEGDQQPYPDLLDPAGTRAGQQVWVTTPALEYATGSDLDLEVEVLESWTWRPQRSKAWLNGLYKVLRDALTHLRAVEGEDAAAVAYLVKQVYKQLSGHFISTDSDTRERPELRGRDDVLDMHHPYAFHAMRAKARVAILHQVLKTGRTTGTWPLVVSNNDLIGYAADQVQDPATAWPGEASKLTPALGGYKLDRWAPMEAQVPHLRTGRGWGGLDDTRKRGEQW